jgi:hypothetical protein
MLSIITEEDPKTKRTNVDMNSPRKAGNNLSKFVITSCDTSYDQAATRNTSTELEP